VAYRVRPHDVEIERLCFWSRCELDSPMMASGGAPAQSSSKSGLTTRVILLHGARISARLASRSLLRGSIVRARFASTAWKLAGVGAFARHWLVASHFGEATIRNSPDQGIPYDMLAILPPLARPMLLARLRPRA